MTSEAHPPQMLRGRATLSTMTVAQKAKVSAFKLAVNTVLES